MTEDEANARSETYRERLTTDFTNMVTSAAGGATAASYGAVIEQMVESAMGAIDALLDELIDRPATELPPIERAMDPYHISPTSRRRTW